MKAKVPITCITANGEEMLADEVATLSVEMGGNGEECDIPFSHLPLSMPILSVRKHVHRGHRCRIQERGGYFRNVVTRKKARFIAKDGVYSIKIRMLGNSKATSHSVPMPSFGRPGTP